jgi:hypothetical protein
MIKPLRKYHYMVWRLWAVLLPIAFVVAITVRPVHTPAMKADEETFTAKITANTDSTFVVTIQVGKPIKVPSCVAILSSTKKDLVLGTLDRQGVYNFNIPTFEGPAHLNLVDAIRQKTITKIPLTKNF